MAEDEDADADEEADVGEVDMDDDGESLYATGVDHQKEADSAEMPSSADSLGEGTSASQNSSSAASKFPDSAITKLLVAKLWCVLRAGRSSARLPTSLTSNGAGPNSSAFFNQVGQF